MYAVMSLNKTVGVKVAGAEHDLPLSYAQGMVGAIPVFDTREHAEAFADGRFEVVQLAVSERE